MICEKRLAILVDLFHRWRRNDRRLAKPSSCHHGKSEEEQDQYQEKTTARRLKGLHCTVSWGIDRSRIVLVVLLLFSFMTLGSISMLFLDLNLRLVLFIDVESLQTKTLSVPIINRVLLILFTAVSVTKPTPASWSPL